MDKFRHQGFGTAAARDEEAGVGELDALYQGVVATDLGSIEAFETADDLAISIMI